MACPVGEIAGELAENIVAGELEHFEVDKGRPGAKRSQAGWTGLDRG